MLFHSIYIVSHCKTNGRLLTGKYRDLPSNFTFVMNCTFRHYNDRSKQIISVNILTKYCLRLDMWCHSAFIREATMDFSSSHQTVTYQYMEYLKYSLQRSELTFVQRAEAINVKWTSNWWADVPIEFNGKWKKKKENDTFMKFKLNTA